MLRGSGSGPSGTMLHAAGGIHTLITVAGHADRARAGEPHTVIDGYVPVGATHLRLDNTAGLSPGDHVILQRPFDENWIHVSTTLTRRVFSPGALTA